MSWPSTFELSILEQNYSRAGLSKIYGKDGVSRYTEYDFEYDSLICSGNYVSIMSKNCIALKTSAFVAAPMVNMVAKNSINLGFNVQEQNSAVTFFAQNLSITARELNVGDLRLTKVPEHAAITCKTLNLSWYAGIDSLPYLKFLQAGLSMMMLK